MIGWKWKKQNTFSEEVASRLPWRFIAIQLSEASWASISIGGRSVLAKSTTCTWPGLRPGKASREFWLLGQSTHNPFGLGQVSKTWSCWGFCVKVYTFIIVSNTTTILQNENYFQRFERIEKVVQNKSNINPLCSMMREVSLECHDKIISVTWPLNNTLKLDLLFNDLYLSLRRRTDFTSLEKSKEITHFFFKSSQIFTVQKKKKLSISDNKIEQNKHQRSQNSNKE